MEEKTPKRHDASGRRGGARRATRGSTRARRARYRRCRFERAVERVCERGGDVPSFELVLELRAAGATLRDEGKNGRDWRKPVSYARCAGDWGTRTRSASVLSGESAYREHVENVPIVSSLRNASRSATRRVRGEATSRNADGDSFSGFRFLVPARRARGARLDLGTRVRA